MTADDVKKTIFLKANKAQGPDGLTAEFFQSSWSIVGKRFTKAILAFFSSFKPTASQPIIFNVNVPFYRENWKQSLFPL